MTKFGKIFCNLVANFKGVQLSPLGFAACQSKNCTNKANRANYRRVWHPAIPTQPPNYFPTEATEPTEVSDARYSPTDCTDGHRLGGYGILPYPRSNQTIFPQNPTQPNHLCASVGGSSPAKASVNSVNSVGEPTQPPNYLPTEPTEVSDARYSPTDCKDVHRLERYGIPAIPTQTPNYLPQKPQNPQKFLTQDILPQIARMGTD